MFKRLAAVIVIALAIAGFAARASADEAAEGRAFYMRYCASCHGVKADGNGPVAKALKEQPTDLRKLGEKFGTPLPAGQIARLIDGRDDITAHGKRDMPVWGERFQEIWAAKGSSAGGMDKRIRKIVTFLDSIQSQSHPIETPSAPVGSLPERQGLGYALGAAQP